MMTTEALERFKLIDLPTEEAQRVKWIAGRKKLGPVFVGHPLEELDGEFIDSLNYIEEAERQGMTLPGFADNIRDMRERLRGIYAYFSAQTQEQDAPEPAVEVAPPAPEPIAPTTFRVYFNRRGSLPWSVDAGPGTPEHQVKNVRIVGLTTESYFEAAAGDNDMTPTAWFEVQNAVMVRTGSEIELVPK